MIVGFTGTRLGLTDPQRISLNSWLVANKPIEFHHGCCVGADAEALFMVITLSQLIGPDTHAYPSTIKGMTDTDALISSDYNHKPKPPLERNLDIVNASYVLLACPKGPEERRSGTWATVRYARKVGKRVVIFWPSGEVTEESK